MEGDSLASIAARFNALYPAAVTDALDSRGLLRQTLPPTLAPLEPGMRLAGPAFTVEARASPSISTDSRLAARTQS